MYNDLISRSIRRYTPTFAIKHTHGLPMPCAKWRTAYLKTNIPFYKSKVAIRINFILSRQAFFLAWPSALNIVSDYNTFYKPKVAIRSNFIYSCDIFGLAF